MHARHPHLRLVGEHEGVERGMGGLAAVVELLAHPRADLLRDLGGVDRRLHAPVDGEQHVELAEVRLHGGLHVGILQLDGQLGAVERAGAMHLAERGRRRRLLVEALEAGHPVRPELGHHAALDEGPAHGRRLVLQGGELGGIFGRQRVGDGRHQLGDLHDRALQPAQRRRESRRIAGATAFQAEQARTGDARGDAADAGADARIARGAGGQAVGFAVAEIGFLGIGQGGPRLLPSTYARPAVLQRAGPSRRSHHAAGVCVGSGAGGRRNRRWSSKRPSTASGVMKSV